MEPALPSDRDERRPRVLVAVGDAGVRQAIAGLLGREWQVEAVPDGAAALAAARHIAPDLVLAELALPGTDGLELLRVLRADRRTRDLPVLILSDRADDELRAAATRAGADDFLVTSVARGDLAARVNTQLQLARARREAAEALRRSEDKYRSLCEHMTEGFALCEIITDGRGTPVDYQILEVNRAWEEATGLSAAAVLGKPAREVIPGLEGYWIEAFGRVALTGEPLHLEQYNAYTGRWHRIAAHRPQPRQFVALVTNISEGKKAEEGLRESEKKYRELFESMIEAYCVIELIFDAAGKAVDFRYLQTNPAFERHATQPMLGKRIKEILPDFEQFWLDQYGRVALTGEPVELEHVVAGLGDQWFHTAAFRVGGADSRRVAVVFVNITERKRAEAALRASEARLLKALSAQTVGVLFFNLDGRIVNANATFERLTGYSLRELQEMPWQALTPPEFQAASARAAGDLADRGETAPYEKQLLRKDGARWWGLFAPTRLSGHGAESECVEFIIDITRRKEAEAALREAKAAAESANAAKDQFLAVLSHELRTPLTPVVLTASMLAGRQDLPADVQADLRGILANAKMEARLIDDLLDLTRIARGKMQFDFKAVDAHQVVRAAAAISAQGDGAPIRLDLGAGRHWVRADDARLQQVVWNLLNNARKFTPAGGQITVRTANAPDGRLRLEVSDTGAGIAAGDVARLFTAFQQGDIDGRRRGGLGLGLAISKAIVDAHGGEIAAQSAGRGAGATFAVTLPAAAPPARPPAATAASPRPGGARPLRLLLVEDHPSTRDTMRRLLANMGHDVRAADGVEAAKAIAAQEPFDLVISDLGLPDGTGHDLMRHLKGRHQLSGIALSGFGMEEDIRRSQEAGFLEHITKPIDLGQLEAALARAAGQGPTDGHAAENGDGASPPSD
jgi:PAS domain S-box-containing protein